MKINLKLILMTILLVVVLTSCAKSISEITADDTYVGEIVTVKGVAQTPVKIGPLSGYTLVDANDDKIIVASDELPSEGDKVTVKGTLEKGLLGLGFYINTNK